MKAFLLFHYILVILSNESNQTYNSALYTLVAVYSSFLINDAMPIDRTPLHCISHSAFTKIPPSIVHPLLPGISQFNNVYAFWPVNLSQDCYISIYFDHLSQCTNQASIITVGADHQVWSDMHKLVEQLIQLNWCCMYFKIKNTFCCDLKLNILFILITK